MGTSLHHGCPLFVLLLGFLAGAASRFVPEFHRITSIRSEYLIVSAGYYYTAPRHTVLLFGQVHRRVLKDDNSMDMELSVDTRDHLGTPATRWDCSPHWTLTTAKILNSDFVRDWMLTWDGYDEYLWYDAWWECVVPQSAIGGAVHRPQIPVVVVLQRGEEASSFDVHLSVVRIQTLSKKTLPPKVVVHAFRNVQSLQLPRSINFWRYHGFNVHIVTAKDQLHWFRTFNYSTINVSAAEQLSIGVYSWGDGHRVPEGSQGVSYNIAFHQAPERIVCFFDADDFLELPVGNEVAHLNSKLRDCSFMSFDFDQQGTWHCPARPCSALNFTVFEVSPHHRQYYAVLQMPGTQGGPLCWVYYRKPRDVAQLQTKMCVRRDRMKVVDVHLPQKLWTRVPGTKGGLSANQMVVHLRKTVDKLQPDVCKVFEKTN